MIDSIKVAIKKVKPAYKLYKFAVRMYHKKQTAFIIPEMSIKRNEILNISMEFREANTFIETGTLFGETIEFLEDQFLKLYSIELSPELAEKAIERFKLNQKIKIINGNSSEQLGVLLKQINSPCIFWLDGHYSSEFWIGENIIKTAKGEKDTPILEELLHIANHEVRNHIILIDDARLFTGKYFYPTIKNLKKLITRKFPFHTFDIKNDIIRILPNNSLC